MSVATRIVTIREQHWRPASELLDDLSEAEEDDLAAGRGGTPVGPPETRHFIDKVLARNERNGRKAGRGARGRWLSRQRGS